MSLQQKISDLFIAKLNFGTEEQKAILTAYTVGVFNLATAGDNYVDRAQANEGPDDAEDLVAGQLVDLAGLLQNISGPGAADQVKTLIAGIYNDPDAELKKVGVELFNASIDYNLGASMLVDLFPAPEPA